MEEHGFITCVITCSLVREKHQRKHYLSELWNRAEYNTEPAGDVSGLRKAAAEFNRI